MISYNQLHRVTFTNSIGVGIIGLKLQCLAMAETEVIKRAQHKTFTQESGVLVYFFIHLGYKELKK